MDRRIPWASTYGNHDSSGVTNATELFQQEMTYNNHDKGRQSWTQRMVDGDDSEVGVTNYYIPVYSHSGCNTKDIALLLWFFDSRGSATANLGQLDDYVAPEVCDLLQRHPFVANMTIGCRLVHEQASRIEGEVQPSCPKSNLRPQPDQVRRAIESNAEEEQEGIARHRPRNRRLSGRRLCRQRPMRAKRCDFRECSIRDPPPAGSLLKPSP